MVDVIILKVYGGGGGIRTISEISVHIKILPSKQIPLYQKISLKAKQLYALGMSYQQIAKSLNVGETTVRRAYKYEDI